MSAADHADPYDLAQQALDSGALRRDAAPVDAYADGARAERVRLIDYLRAEAMRAGHRERDRVLRGLVADLTASLNL